MLLFCILILILFLFLKLWLWIFWLWGMFVRFLNKCLNFCCKNLFINYWMRFVIGGSKLNSGVFVSVWNMIFIVKRLNCRWWLRFFGGWWREMFMWCLMLGSIRCLLYFIIYLINCVVGLILVVLVWWVLVYLRYWVLKWCC